MNEGPAQLNQERLKELILLAKNGDPTSFEEIYTLYYTPLFRYILNRIKIKQEAEDLAQTVFMKIWTAIPTWDSTHTSPLAFFFTVARNTLIDYFRKNKHREIVSDEIILKQSETEITSDEQSISREHKEGLGQAILKLSEEQQEIIRLYYTNDLTYREIATITGKREDAIRQIHSRAIKKLREIYSI